MKKYFSIIYWLLATLLSSFMYLSYLDSFLSAWLLSNMMLPGVLIVKYFAPIIKKETLILKIIHGFYLAVFTLYIEYLCVLIAYWYLFESNIKNLPKIIVNPVFLAMWLFFYIIIEKIVVLKFIPNQNTDNNEIEFISNRKRIKIKLNLISFIESNNNEVWVNLSNGKRYRTKMRISQWQEVLEYPFVRIHRSFIVNSNHIQQIENNSMQVNNIKLDISRKYKKALNKIM